MVKDAIDVACLQRATQLGQIELHDTLPSTQARAAELTANAETSLPLLVVAEEQVAGRGRGENWWWSPRGALLLSYAAELPPAAAGRQSQLVSLATALAVCDAVDSVFAEYGTTERCQIKWPNDVYVENKKLAGMIVDRPHTAGRQLVVLGIGANVNNLAANAPPELQRQLTAVCDITGTAADRTAMLAKFTDSIARRMQALAATPDEIVAQCRARCLLTGKAVEVTSGGETRIGTCDGIASDGRLAVRTAAGVELVASGTVRLK